MSKEIKQVLNHHGIKATHQRMALYKTLVAAAEPLSAERLKDALKEETLNLSTVYRSLEAMVCAGLVTKSYHSIDQKHRYEVARSEHRHYLICKGCNKIEPLEGCPLHHYEETLSNQLQYQILSHKLEIIGLCPECQSK